MRNKLAVILLVICLLSSAKSVSAQETYLQFFNYPGDNISIEISGKDLILDNFPDEDQFSYVLLDLINDNGEEYNRYFTSSQNTILYSLDNLPDGCYYLEIFNSSSRYGSYQSYIYGKTGIKIEISEDKAIFIDPETLINNITLFDSRRSDKEAIDYYMLPSYGVESDNDEIIQLAENITDGLLTDYERLKAIHDWVSINIWYDYDVLYGRESIRDTGALETLHSSRSVCQGYASLTAALLRAIKIPAKIVSGYVLGIGSDGQWTEDILQSNETNHAWNEAYVDNRWIILDTTWDSNNKYENGVFGSIEEGMSNLYFDSSLEIFSLTHKLISDDTEVDAYYQNLEELKLSYLEKIAISPATKILYLGNKEKSSFMLKVSIPEMLKSYDVKVDYKSNNANVVKVSKNGKVTAVGKGKTTITATIYIDNNQLTRKATIIVK